MTKRKAKKSFSLNCRERARRRKLSEVQDEELLLKVVKMRMKNSISRRNYCRSILQ